MYEEWCKQDWSCKTTAPLSAKTFYVTWCFCLEMMEVFLYESATKSVLSVVWWWWRRPCVHTMTAFCLGERKLGTSMPIGDSLKIWSICTCTVWIEGENRHMLTMWLAVRRCFQDHWEGLLVTKDLYCWWHVSIFVRCNHDKFCPGSKVSEGFINLLLCFYASGGCILGCMPICVS